MFEAAKILAKEVQEPQRQVLEDDSIMKLKPGYKQTEVGIIPEEWDVKPLATMCSAVLDCHHSTPVWTSVGAVVLRNQNIRDGRLDLSEPSFTDERHFIERTRRAVPNFGDLVITREAPMGQVCMIPRNLKCCLGQRMVLLRINGDAAESKYLLYAIQGEAVQRSIYVAGGTGSTVSNLRIPILKELLIPAPKPPEQRAIAEALSDVDALIGALDRLIAKKRDLKQAAMQQLLTGKKRLPDFHGEWETVQLRSFVRSHNSGVYKNIESYGKGCNIIGVSDLYGIDRVDGQTFAQVPLYSAEQAKHALQPNDLLYGESSLVREGIARTVYVTERGAGTAFAWHTRRYSVDQKALLSSYLYYYLQSRPARKHMMDQSIQTAITGINTAAYFGCPVLTPPLPEQTAIAEVLSDMDAELAALEQRRDKTRALKQAMMQELLTGRTRLV